MQIAQSVTALATPPMPYHYHYSLHPRIYVAPYTNNQSSSYIQTIDGDITKPFWSSIPWSSNFDDIRGPIDSPQNERPNANCTTKFKMAYDDEYLYILALIESDFNVRATYTKRNSPIFQQDSDFEVFIDPLGTCHNYKELEINALNTVWNLMLDKPYWDGGCEHSGRIAKEGDEKYYDVCLQKTAVKIIEGSIHDESNQDDKDDYSNTEIIGKQKTVWAVEMALSHQDTLKHTMINCSVNTDTTAFEANRTTRPNVGDMWRINFSRVEKKGNINWTWQQQRVWDAKLHKHLGKVDMHLPDVWGYVRFGSSISQRKQDSSDHDQPEVQAGEIPMEEIHSGKGGDPLWPFKLAVANVYYAQKAYKNEHGQKYYAKTMDELKGLLDEKIFCAFDPSMINLNTSDDRNSFLFRITDSVGGNNISITNERFIIVETNDNDLLNIIQES